MHAEVRQFQGPRKLVFGPHAVRELGSEVRRLGAHRPLLVCDPGVAAGGPLGEATSALGESGLQYGLFDSVKPEPPASLPSHVADQARADSHDCVVGIGGGSAIDVAKLAAILARHPAPIGNFFGIDKVPGKGLPLIAVPTTSGTGSESTPIAVFGGDDDESKQGIVSPYLIPDVAIVDSLLSRSCPRPSMAAAGMDALIHNIESYLSVNSSILTRTLSLEGIELVSQSLPAALAGESAALERLAQGSMLGGLAFGNAGVAAVHALSLPVGGKFHVAHGVANSVMLPYVMSRNLEACPDLFVDIAEALGIPTNGTDCGDAGEMALEFIRQLSRAAGMPQTLSEVGVVEVAIPQLADAASKQTRLMGNNPRQFTFGEIEAIYREAYRS